MRYDCLVIGGGVVGTAILDRIATYNAKSILLEKDNDVASFATRANSGIVHAGYDCEPNTLKAKFNVLGNKLMWKVVKELDVPHLKCASIVVAQKDQLENLQNLKSKADANGVETEILDKKQTLKVEPNISNNIEYSLYAPTAGIVSPYQLAIGFADRAITNGAEIKTNSKVIKIEKVIGGFEVSTKKETYFAKTVINCAGAYGAFVNDLANAEHYDTEYRRGDYFVLDNKERANIETVIFPLPTEAGKGILVAPTADGNVIYGPTSIQTQADDTASTLDGLAEIRKNVPLSYSKPAFNKCIRTYSGIRTLIGHDFVIQKSQKIENFYMAIGICSPGLTSAPAIGEYVGDMVCNDFGFEKKAEFVVDMPKHLRLLELSESELENLVSENSAWGRIVCRCEKITEAEVVDAIHSPLKATTVDAVKRRCRAGMGRCQGGFCGPRVMEIIASELNIPLNEVKKGNDGSEIARFHIKEVPND